MLSLSLASAPVAAPVVSPAAPIAPVLVVNQSTGYASLNMAPESGVSYELFIYDESDTASLLGTLNSGNSYALDVAATRGLYMRIRASRMGQYSFSSWHTLRNDNILIATNGSDVDGAAIADNADIRSVTFQGGRTFDAGTANALKFAGGKLVRGSAAGSFWINAETGKKYLDIEFDVLAPNGGTFDDSSWQAHVWRIGVTGNAGDTAPNIQFYFKSNLMEVHVFNGSWGMIASYGGGWSEALTHGTKVRMKLFHDAGDSKDYLQVYRAGVAQIAGKGLDVLGFVEPAGTRIEYRRGSPNGAEGDQYFDNLQVKDFNKLPVEVVASTFVEPSIFLAAAGVNVAFAHHGAGSHGSWDAWLHDRAGKTLGDPVNILSADLGAGTVLPLSSVQPKGTEIWATIRAHDDHTVCGSFMLGEIPRFAPVVAFADQAIGMNEDFVETYADTDFAFDLMRTARWVWAADSSAIIGSYADGNGVPNGTGSGNRRAILKEGGLIARPGATARLSGIAGSTVTVQASAGCTVNAVDANNKDIVFDSSGSWSLTLEFAGVPTGGFDAVTCKTVGVADQLVNPQCKADYGLASGFNAARPIRFSDGENVVNFHSSGAIFNRTKIHDPAFVAAAHAEMGHKTLYWPLPINATDTSIQLLAQQLAGVSAAALMTFIFAIGNETPWNYGFYDAQNYWMFCEVARRGWVPGIAAGATVINDLERVYTDDLDTPVTLKSAVTTGQIIALCGGANKRMIVEAKGNWGAGTHLDHTKLTGESDTYWHYRADQATLFDLCERFRTVRTAEVKALVVPYLGARAKTVRDFQRGASPEAIVQWLRKLNDLGQEVWSGIDYYSIAAYFDANFAFAGPNSSTMAKYNSDVPAFVSEALVLLNAALDSMLTSVSETRHGVERVWRDTVGIATGTPVPQMMLYEAGNHTQAKQSGQFNVAQMVTALQALVASEGYKTLMKHHAKALLSMGLPGIFFFNTYQSIRVRGADDGAKTIDMFGYRWAPTPASPSSAPLYTANDNSYLGLREAIAETAAEAA
jgi:hypothetical protein